MREHIIFLILLEIFCGFINIVVLHFWLRLIFDYIRYKMWKFNRYLQLKEFFIAHTIWIVSLGISIFGLYVIDNYIRVIIL